MNDLTTPVSAYVDGWYSQRIDADAALADCAELGAAPVGIIESKFKTYGIIYVAPATGWIHEDCHRIGDPHGAIAGALRLAVRS